MSVMPTTCGAMVTMTSAEKIESTKQLIRLGLALLPLVPGGKTPAGPWARGEWTYDRLVRYLEEHPDANIGAMTGSASYDLAVIDVDNHGVDGRKFMRAFERAEGKLGETLTVRTGSGGTHLYYRVPSDVPLPRNSTNPRFGVDIRGEGGYVVAPPSVLEGGGGYRFLPGRGPGEVDIATADERVLKLIATIQGKGSREQKKTGGLDLIVGKGGRNDACYRYACHIRAWGGTPQDVAVMTAGYNATLCRPRLGGSEVLRIVKNACTHEPGEDIVAKAALLPDVGAPRFGEASGLGQG